MLADLGIVRAGGGEELGEVHEVGAERVDLDARRGDLGGQVLRHHRRSGADRRVQRGTAGRSGAGRAGDHHDLPDALLDHRRGDGLEEAVRRLDAALDQAVQVLDRRVHEVARDDLAAEGRGGVESPEAAEGGVHQQRGGLGLGQVPGAVDGLDRGSQVRAARRPGRSLGLPSTRSWPRRASSRARAGPDVAAGIAHQRHAPWSVGHVCSSSSNGVERQDLDGDGVEAGVARERVDRLVAGEHVAVDPVGAGGDLAARARRRRDPNRGEGSPCRRAISSVTSTSGLDLRRCRSDHARRRAVGSMPRARRVVGVHLQRAAGLALHQHLDVVHPGVVGAQVATTDQQQTLVGWRRRAAPASRATSARIGSASELDLCPTPCAASPASRGSSGPRSMPWGAVAERLDVEALVGPVRSIRSSIASIGGRCARLGRGVRVGIEPGRSASGDS